MSMFQNSNRPSTLPHPNSLLSQKQNRLYWILPCARCKKRRFSTALACTGKVFTCAALQVYANYQHPVGVASRQLLKVLSCNDPVDSIVTELMAGNIQMVRDKFSMKRNSFAEPTLRRLPSLKDLGVEPSQCTSHGSLPSPLKSPPAVLRLTPKKCQWSSEKNNPIPLSAPSTPNFLAEFGMRTPSPVPGAVSRTSSQQAIFNTSYPQLMSPFDSYRGIHCHPPSSPLVLNSNDSPLLPPQVPFYELGHSHIFPSNGVHNEDAGTLTMKPQEFPRIGSIEQLKAQEFPTISFIEHPKQKPQTDDENRKGPVGADEDDHMSESQEADDEEEAGEDYEGEDYEEEAEEDEEDCETASDETYESGSSEYDDNPKHKKRKAKQTPVRAKKKSNFMTPSPSRSPARFFREGKEIAGPHQQLSVSHVKSGTSHRSPPNSAPARIKTKLPNNQKTKVSFFNDQEKQTLHRAFRVMAAHRCFPHPKNNDNSKSATMSGERIWSVIARNYFPNRGNSINKQLRNASRGFVRDAYDSEYKAIPRTASEESEYQKIMENEENIAENNRPPKSKKQSKSSNSSGPMQLSDLLNISMSNLSGQNYTGAAAFTIPSQAASGPLPAPNAAAQTLVVPNHLVEPPNRSLMHELYTHLSNPQNFSHSRTPFSTRQQCWHLQH